jgi:hypothetical protein
MALLAAATLLAGCGGGSGGSATPAPADTSGTLQLSWDAPSENTDGSPLDDLAGYRIYYGTASGRYDHSVTIAGADATGYTLDHLPAGTYYAVVKAYAGDGTESDASAEVSKTIR